MKKYFAIVILLGCAILFAFGIGQLFELRFEAGDVYPPYSTLRADPLGTMAFYESLGKVPGISVRRDFSTSNRLPDQPGTAYVQLAAGAYDWRWLPDDLFHEIKNFVGSGGRLVIAYLPQTEAPYYFGDDEDETNSIPSMKPKTKNGPAEKSAKRKKHGKTGESWVDLEEEWGIYESFQDLPQEEGVYQPVTVVNRSDQNLPQSLDWHSGVVFTNCDSAWRVIYARGKYPVVVERKFGKGSVVFAGDSYFVSNEAMIKDRQPELLAWLIGANTNIVFDEAHFGIADSSGVATLMRQYRLHGLAAGLLLLAGLFIWKNATSLAPPHSAQASGDFVAGKDSASGFVNLLRRNIATRDISGVCFAEWKKSVAPSGQISNARVQRAEALFQAENSRPAGERDPVGTYQEISKTLGTFSGAHRTAPVPDATMPQPAGDGLSAKTAVSDADSTSPQIENVQTGKTKL